MKNDKLEKFVRDNRAAFDYKQEPAGSWDRIADALFGRKRTLWNSVPIWRAAAVVLLGICIFQFMNSGPGLSVASSQQREFTDVESYYAEQISEKTELIQSEDSFIDNSFAQDLEKLEAMHSVLSEEMKRHPSQKVKDALVLNMLVRIDMLNQLLQKVEESKRKMPEAQV